MTLKMLFPAFVCGVFFAATQPVNAQPAEEAASPTYLTVDLAMHEGWGPFAPAASHAARHHTGRFTVNGMALEVALLSKPNATTTGLRQIPIIFYPAGQKPRAVPLESKNVAYPYERVRLGATDYDILQVSLEKEQLVLVESTFDGRARSAPQAGVPAPDFEATTLDGASFKLSELRGKYVLLDFWGTWCSPCVEHVPYLEIASVRYSSAVIPSGSLLEIVGIAKDDAEKVEAFQAKRPETWRQIIQPEDDSPVLTLYGVKGYPTYILIDPEGVIASTNQGIFRGQEIVRTLKRLLPD